MELQDIIKALPKRSFKKIAKKAGVSSSMVSQVFNGDKESDKVIDAAIEIIAEANRKKAEQIRKFKEATSL